MLKRTRRTRDEHERWDFGSGAVTLGEHIEDAVRREVYEEYGTTVLTQEFLGYRDAHRAHEGTPTHWLALDFHVLIDRSLVRIGEPQKFSELGWFDLNHLPAPLHSTIPEILLRYRSKLLAPHPAPLAPV